MKIELVINDSLRIPVGYEMLESVLGHFEVDSENGAVLEALAEHPAKDVRVKLAGKQNLSEAAFRKLFATRDFYVIQELLRNGSARPYFSKDVLAGLVSQSEFACLVAGSLEDFQNADDAVVELLARHPDPCVRNALAGHYDTPAKFRKLLSIDADPGVAKSARQSME
jgi:hypothetical protein